jgi:hypothetical protein
MRDSVLQAILNQLTEWHFGPTFGPIMSGNMIVVHLNEKLVIGILHDNGTIHVRLMRRSLDNIPRHGFRLQSFDIVDPDFFWQFEVYLRGLPDKMAHQFPDEFGFEHDDPSCGPGSTVREQHRTHYIPDGDH